MENNDEDEGTIFGLLGAVIVFIFVWFYLVSKWGFIFGILLGWIPAGILFFITGIILSFFGL